MMVNGKPRWTCRTHVQKVLDRDGIEIAPLRNLPVIKDLVADMTEFFGKWIKAEGQFHPTATREDGIAPVLPSSPERQAASAGIECINCAVCYAVRRGRIEPELSRAGGAQPRLDAGQRCAGRWKKESLAAAEPLHPPGTVTGAKARALRYRRVVE